MNGGFTGDVRVLAGWQIDALHQAEPGQQLEGAKDGGPTDRRAAAPRGRQHILRGEVSAALRDHVRHDATRAGQAQAGAAKRADDRILRWHR